ncbi:hypothetical protein NQ317_017720 [Molorchus minor]|uniref:XK-related protein n=1 Tax=Molorchus minor TaxID=1323400 RepID=A0ABQ9J6L0_9CUCU|nr:hypothetical protein NQ317_017720 [Molorchus minor]
MDRVQGKYVLHLVVNSQTVANNPNNPTTKDEEHKVKTSHLGNMSSKYQVFQENDNEIILDVYEERLKYSNLLENHEEDDPLLGLNLERGQTGVFNIEDLVEVLKRENAEDIFIAKVPSDIKYVDYISIVSGKSQKHMQAIAQFVRKVYKKKRHKNDIIPILEGKNSSDWMALDLGNIALHIFSKKMRKMYDLDSLWILGPHFDKECNKKGARIRNVRKTLSLFKRFRTSLLILCLILGYELTPHQDAIFNYLVPSIGACILYMFLIASDVAVICNHLKNGDPIWASLSWFIMYLPVMGSYIIFISNWELWPEYEGCGRENMRWFFVKTTQHLFFPVWNMWRFAERIFWSIEAVRSKNETDIMQAIAAASSARTIELYVFLQSYVHSIPQILLQLHILMRHNAETNKQTADAQVLSILFNIAKISITTTFYQRFKAQKLTGKQYPWYKSDLASRQSSVVLRRNISEVILEETRSIVEKRMSTDIEKVYNVEPSTFSQRRRSSDIYLEPSTSTGYDRRETLQVDFNTTDNEDHQTSSPYGRPSLSRFSRVISVMGETKSKLFREMGISERSEPDFNVSRIIYIKGLQDDDLAGKLIAFLWWFCFLLARFLAISAFAYFFIKDALWILLSHFIIVMAFFTI